MPTRGPRACKSSGNRAIAAVGTRSPWSLCVDANQLSSCREWVPVTPTLNQTLVGRRRLYQFRDRIVGGPQSRGDLCAFRMSLGRIRAL